MGCCVSTSAGADDAGPSASSRGFAPAFDDASTLVVDDDSLPVADGDELADVVRDVFAELDPALRRALAPSLRRTRGKRLGDDYDESDAELIGKGAFSVVYLVRHRRTGGSFAAKIISTEGVTPERRREHIRALLCEAGVAAAAAHDTIVAFRDLFFEPDRAILVQEYCHGGTLLRTVQRKVDRKRSSVASPALAPSAKSAASAAARASAGWVPTRGVPTHTRRPPRRRTPRRRRRRL